MDKEEEERLQCWASKCPTVEVTQLGTSSTHRNVLVSFAVVVALELLLESLLERVVMGKVGAAANAQSAGLVGWLLLWELPGFGHVVP